MAVEADAVAVGLVRFDFQCFDDPKSDVADDEECYQFATGFTLLQLDTVATPA